MRLVITKFFILLSHFNIQHSFSAAASAAAPVQSSTVTDIPMPKVSPVVQVVKEKTLLDMTAIGHPVNVDTLNKLLENVFQNIIKYLITELDKLRCLHILVSDLEQEIKQKIGIDTFIKLKEPLWNDAQKDAQIFDTYIDKFPIIANELEKIKAAYGAPL